MVALRQEVEQVQRTEAQQVYDAILLMSDQVDAKLIHERLSIALYNSQKGILID